MNDPIHILYVDDHPLDRKVVRNSLEKEYGEFHLIEVSSRARFYDKLAEGGFDLVLADFDVWDLEYLQVLDMVKERMPHVPVIILTGTGSEDLAVEAMKKGACDYITKTAEHIRHLPAAIRSIMERKVLAEARQGTREDAARTRENDKLQSILDSMQDGVCVINRDFQIEYANPALQIEFGSGGNLKCYEYFHDYTEQCSWCRNNEVFQGGSVRWEWDFPKAGKTFDIFETPMRNADGSVSKLVIFHDVTNLIRAQEALRKSEELSKTLIQASPLAIFSLTPTGEVTSWNRAAEAIFGWSEEEALGKPLPIVGPESVREFQAIREQLLTGEGFSGLELRRRRKDGSNIDISLSAAPLRDQFGRVEGTMSLAADITEHKKAKQELVESRSRLKLLNSILTSLLSGLSVEEITAWAVETISEHFPHYRVAYFTISPDGFMRMTHSVEPEGMPRMRGLEVDLGAAPDYLSALRIREAFVVDDINREPRLAPFLPVMAEAGMRAILDVPVNQWSELVGILCFGAPFPHQWNDHELKTLTEIAELLSFVHKEAQARKDHQESEKALQRSEALMRSILRTLPVGIGLVINRTLDWPNESFCRMTGYSLEELVGKNPLFLYEDEREYERVGRALFTGKTHKEVRFVETRWKRRDGTLIDIELTGAPINPSDMETGSVLCVLDITDSKRSENERCSLEAQLIQAQKMESVGRLAAGVAHDFNNLLSPILGYSEMILEDARLQEGMRMQVEEIHSAGERAKNLTRQLLAFGRKQVLEMMVLNLNDLVTDFQKMLRRLIGEDIRMQTRLEPHLGLVRADVSQFEQVLLNLAINARDAMPNGGTITVETANVLLDEGYAQSKMAFVPGPYVMLGLHDTGHGMDSETLGQVFEPFFTTKEKGKGTGLGLSTVYGIVKQHGGHIWVYSEPGHGTAFKIYLPRVEAPSALPETALSKTKVTDPAGKETILIAEDEESMRKLIQNALLRHGYHVIESMDVQDAARIAREYTGRIDLLITDVIMPEMNGRQLFKIISAFHPSVKVLFMSGYTDDIIARHGVLEEGINFLQKPFSLQDLTEKVHAALNAPR